MSRAKKEAAAADWLNAIRPTRRERVAIARCRLDAGDGWGRMFAGILRRAPLACPGCHSRFGSWRAAAPGEIATLDGSKTRSQFDEREGATAGGSETGDIWECRACGGTTRLPSVKIGQTPLEGQTPGRRRRCPYCGRRVTEDGSCDTCGPVCGGRIRIEESVGSTNAMENALIALYDLEGLP